MYISYSIFSKLYDEAFDVSCFDYYVSERGWQDWMGDDEGNVDEVIRILQFIYDAAHSDFKWIRNQLGISQIEMSAMYDIPRRTIQNWEGGERVPPDYVKKLLSYAIIGETINNKVIDE